MKTTAVGFIGGGRITRIFLQAFKNNQVVTSKVVVYDTNPDALLRPIFDSYFYQD